MTFRELRRRLYREVLRDKGRLMALRLLKAWWWGEPPKRVVMQLRLAQWWQARGATLLAHRQLNGLARRFGVYVGEQTRIGPGLRMPHPTSIVLGRHISIGECCRLYQQVTIAGAPKWHAGPGPFRRLGDRVTIYPGAKVVGDGCVGDDVIIGANAVVTRPFPDGVVVAGVPAHIVGPGGDEEMS